MAQQWSDRILLAELADEPELSEEIAGIYERLKTIPPGKKPPSVVLNFAGVTFLNSSHIASLLRLRKKLVESGRTLVLCTLSDELWSVIMLTGLDKIFIVAPDTSTALARVQLDTRAEGNQTDS